MSTEQSKTPWTPGEWESGYDGHGGIYIYACNGGQIGYVREGQRPPYLQGSGNGRTAGKVRAARGGLLFGRAAEHSALRQSSPRIASADTGRQMKGEKDGRTVDEYYAEIFAQIRALKAEIEKVQK